MQKSVAVFFGSGGGELTFTITAGCQFCGLGVVEFPALRVGWREVAGYVILSSERLRGLVESYWKSDPERVRGACRGCGTMAQLTRELACAVLERQDWLAQVAAA